MILPRLPGTHVFIGRLAAPTAIIVGRLGRIAFPAGDYAYVGSAFGPGGITARVSHHLAASTRPRWHLDYLRPRLTPLAVWFTTDARSHEHAWADALSGIRGAGLPCPGFGSSDCACQSHLIRFRRLPAVATFRRHIAGSHISGTYEIRFEAVAAAVNTGCSTTAKRLKIGANFVKGRP